ncbi:MAG: apolipoprotein N-acyltransferase, partial [Proteobacteria bacterium]
YIGDVWRESRDRDSDVLMGIMRIEDVKPNEPEVWHNSLVALGRDEEPAFYDKSHLVPFGEYFPVPKFVREWARLMSLPNSDFLPGAAVQAPLTLAGTALSASICYEDAYGSTQLPTVRRSKLLVNVTNDAWFGRSSARYLHLQIARMRAIEARRPMLRVANDGVTAVIGERGALVATAPEYEAAVLRATVQPRMGDTPYLRAGNWPIVLLCTFTLGGVGLGRWRESSRGRKLSFQSLKRP